MRIDCHCHIFDNDCVPVTGVMASRLGLAVSSRFFYLLHDIGMGRVGKPWEEYFNGISWNPVEAIRSLIDPQEKDNLHFIVNNLENFLRFLEIGRLDIPQILKEMQQKSRGIDIWVPLMMDMTHGFPGSKSDRNINNQQEIMSSLTLENEGQIMPFIAFDPRQPDPIEKLKNAIEYQGFVGIKLYPPLGFKPLGNKDPEIDKILRDLYSFCCQHSDPIPITAHCSWSGGAYSNEQPGTEIRDIKAYYRGMAHPKHWKEVLKEFPSLKLNLAHFGGLGEWDAMAKDETPRENWVDEIVTLIKDYQNVYTDLSYQGIPATDIVGGSRYKRLLLEKIAGIEDKVLLGSDWYMSRIQCRLQDYWHGFESLFPDLFMKMTGENAIAFLRSNASTQFFPSFFSRNNRSIQDRLQNIFTSP